MVTELQVLTLIPSSFLPLAFASIHRSTMRAPAATVGLLRPAAVAASRSASTSIPTLTTGATTFVTTAERCALSQNNAIERA